MSGLSKLHRELSRFLERTPTALQAMPEETFRTLMRALHVVTDKASQMHLLDGAMKALSSGKGVVLEAWIKSGDGAHMVHELERGCMVRACIDFTRLAF